MQFLLKEEDNFRFVSPPPFEPRQLPVFQVFGAVEWFYHIHLQRGQERLIRDKQFQYVATLNARPCGFSVLQQTLRDKRYIKNYSGKIWFLILRGFFTSLPLFEQRGKVYWMEEEEVDNSAEAIPTAYKLLVFSSLLTCILKTPLHPSILVNGNQ